MAAKPRPEAVVPLHPEGSPSQRRAEMRRLAEATGAMDAAMQDQVQSIRAFADDVAQLDAAVRRLSDTSRRAAAAIVPVDISAFRRRNAEIKEAIRRAEKKLGG